MLSSSILISEYALVLPGVPLAETRVLFVTVMVEPFDPAELSAALMFKHAHPLSVLSSIVMLTGLKVVIA